MTFLESIFSRIGKSADQPILREIHEGHVVPFAGAEFLSLVVRARRFLAKSQMKPGDRCALLAANSARWAALDLAMMAEGLIVVPLYARQAPVELMAMMRDSTPLLICCADAALAGEIRKQCDAPPAIALFDEIFESHDSGGSGKTSDARPPFHHADSDPVTIIYTSGTSGEPKGVVLNAGNVSHMLGCTNGRLDQLMGARSQPDEVFHYLPFCFAGSWILLLTALSRSSVLSLSSDLTKIADELKVVTPDYFMNVPTLLERVRVKIEENIRKRGGWTASAFAGAKRAYMQRQAGAASRLLDSLCLWFGNTVMFAAIRKNIGARLKALICGSAPLSSETQLFFMMLGIPVLQVYGLTETTAICTMDDPRSFEPGRVGQAIPGIEMKVAESGEILARGPNIFPGYWQRPAETAKALKGGWFHTGDLGAVDANGNWQITGRLKNLIILNSGHNIAPEPMEEELASQLPLAQQVVLIGNQRSFLAALVTAGGANGSQQNNLQAQIQAALDAANSGLPHYKQIRAFHLVPEVFSIENGLLTANGKLKRDLISARYAADIENLYQKKPA